MMVKSLFFSMRKTAMCDCLLTVSCILTHVSYEQCIAEVNRFWEARSAELSALSSKLSILSLVWYYCMLVATVGGTF